MLVVCRVSPVVCRAPVRSGGAHPHKRRKYVLARVTREHGHPNTKQLNTVSASRPRAHDRAPRRPRAARDRAGDARAGASLLRWGRRRKEGRWRPLVSSCSDRESSPLTGDDAREVAARLGVAAAGLEEEAAAASRGMLWALLETGEK